MTPEAVPHQEMAKRDDAALAFRPTARFRWLGLVGAALVLVVSVAGSLRWLRHEDPDAIWSVAEAALKDGQIDQAEAAVRRLGRLRAPTPLDWMLRGQVSLARQQVDRAVSELAHVPDDHPVAPQARFMAGQAELRRHRARIAEQLFRAAVRLDPGQAAAHRELIYILGYQLRRNELAAEFQALGEVSDLTFDNVFHWCLLRSALWDPDTAVDELELFIQADPEDRWSRLALADNYRRLTRLDDVERVLAPLPPSDPLARVIRVMLALDRHQDDTAEELLCAGPDVDPRIEQLKGRLALARRDSATAVRCFKIAHAGLPDDRDALFGLINALSLAGEDKAAAPLREIMKRHERLNSLIQRVSTTGQRQNGELLRELGEACAALSRVPEARAWYKLAIARDPLDTQAQQALFQLDERARSTHPVPSSPSQTPQG